MIKDKETILKEARGGKATLNIEEQELKITSDFSSEIQKVRNSGVKY